MKIYRQIGDLLTLTGVAKKHGRHVQKNDLDIQRKAALVVNNNKIVWIGADRALPKVYSREKNVLEINCRHQTVLPGLVECHTHLVFAGSRADEFEMRLGGMSYGQISAKGGGILSTVKKTRALDAKSLLSLAQQRAKNFYDQGIRTLEVKSGYGLDLKSELKMLRVANSIQGLRVVPTFLGAHAKPPEFASYEQYLDFLLKNVLPQVKKHKLANRVDIFIEKGFFEKESSEKYLKEAKAMGFQLTIHADQLSLSGGSALAVQLQAQSADHMICIGQSEIQKFTQLTSPVAVLLPLADLYMRCPYPPARDLIDAGACVALATDFNPGTSPCQDISLVGLLARLQMKMTLPEVIAGYTWNAAKALGLQDSIGSLEVGKCGEVARFNCEWTDLFYSPGSLFGFTIPDASPRESKRAFCRSRLSNSRDCK